MRISEKRRACRMKRRKKLEFLWPTRSANVYYGNCELQFRWKCSFPAISLIDSYAKQIAALSALRPFQEGNVLSATQHTTHSTQHTAHNTQHTAHNTHHTAHSTQHIAHSTQHTARDSDRAVCSNWVNLQLQ